MARAFSNRNRNATESTAEETGARQLEIYAQVRNLASRIDVGGDPRGVSGFIKNYPELAVKWREQGTNRSFAMVLAGKAHLREFIYLLNSATLVGDEAKDALLNEPDARGRTLLSIAMPLGLGDFVKYHGAREPVKRTARAAAGHRQYMHHHMRQYLRNGAGWLGAALLRNNGSGAKPKSLDTGARATV